MCTNSSSLPSSLLIGKVGRPERVLNTHFQQPPELNAVELMSCGATDEGIFDALMAKFPQYGLVPFRVLKESDGFIFNRRLGGGQARVPHGARRGRRDARGRR